jgi:hypothetical protein
MEIALIVESILALSKGVRAVMVELKLPTTDFDTEMGKLESLIKQINDNDTEWRKNHPG